MSYELSFAEEFFTGEPDGELGGDDIRACYPASKRPQCVMQALVSEEKYRPQLFRETVNEALGYSLKDGDPVNEHVFWDLLEAIKKYDTCDTLSSPIDVYIDKTHYVTVYEDKEEEVA